MDLVDLKEKVLNEQASKQAVDIIESLKRAFLKDPHAKYAVFSEHYNMYGDLIHAKNIAHLYENGFRVWRVSGITNGSKNRSYKYFFCWDVEDFHKEVFEDCVADKYHSNYDYVELVPKSR